MPYFTTETRVRAYEIICAFVAGFGLSGALAVLVFILNGGLACPM